MTLLLFPWLVIAQPYQFTEIQDGGGWVLLGLIIVSGSLLPSQLQSRTEAGRRAVRHRITDAVLQVPLRTGLAPSAFPAEMLEALRQFTDCLKLQSNTDEALGFLCSNVKYSA